MVDGPLQPPLQRFAAGLRYRDHGSSGASGSGLARHRANEAEGTEFVDRVVHGGPGHSPHRPELAGGSQLLSQGETVRLALTDQTQYRPLPRRKLRNFGHARGYIAP